MASKDYYQILGLQKSASSDEIRRAYRKLARQFHPDVNKDKDAQAKFTEVQDAYDTLSDEAKRKRYDRFGTAEPAAAGAPGRAHYSWSNVAGGQGRGGFDQADLDPETLGSMFEAFFGGRAQESAGPRRARTSRGAARQRPAQAEATLEVSFLTAAKGGTERFRVESQGKGRTIDVKIPRGTADGAKLRIQGGSGEGAAAGDLILTIRVGQHPLLKREGDGLDLRVELPLTIAEAVLGAVVSVPTLGGTVELTIPPGTSSGQRFRLRGRGIEDAAGRQGDMYVVTRIVVPPTTGLSDEQQRLLRAVSEAGPAPRSGEQWKTV